MKLSREGWTGLAVLAASLFLFWLTLDLKGNPLVPIGPGFYPRIVLGLTAGLASMLLIFDLLKSFPGKDQAKPNYGMVFMVFAVFGVYVAAIPALGFRISTFLFIAALQPLLERPKGARGWLLVLVTALVTTVITYFLFERYLLVLLPRGSWTGF